MKNFIKILIFILSPLWILAADVESTVKNVSAKECCDGAITLTINGGTAPFTFSWSGVNGFTSTQKDISNVCEGTYNVTVTDAKCATAVLTVNVGNENIQVQETSIINVSFCEFNAGDSGDGSIHLEQGNFVSFHWIGPNGFSSWQRDIDNLAHGVYTVEATLSNGCKVTKSFELCCCQADKTNSFNMCQEGPPISEEFNPDIKAPTSVSSNDGYIHTNMTASSLKYNWTGPNGFSSTDKDIDGLRIGQYCVTITDNCFRFERCFDLKVCEETSISITSADITNTCNGYSEGKIKVYVYAENQPIYFKWSNGSTRQENSYLAAGTYCVTVTDNGGCSATGCYTIVPSNPVIKKSSDTECSEEHFCNGRKVNKISWDPIRRWSASDCRFVETYCVQTGKVINYAFVSNYTVFSRDLATCTQILLCPDGVTTKFDFGRTEYVAVEASYVLIDGVYQLRCIYDIYCVFDNPTYTKINTGRKRIGSAPRRSPQSIDCIDCPECGGFGKYCIFKYYCDDVYIGYECVPWNQCYAQPNGGDNLDLSNSKIEYILLENNEKIKTIPIKLKFNSKNELSTKIYPNPFESNVEINIENGNFDDQYYFELYNSAGILVEKHSFESDYYNINLDYLNSGIYFLKVLDSKYQIISNNKIVKIKN